MTPSNTQCIVVFPVYRPITETEYAFLRQAISMTPGYKQVFVAPLSFTFDESYKDLRNLEVVRFNDSYFAGIVGYNYLMLSSEFYDAFSSYEYILIHQSDAYLFSPDLACWCNKGYDYIGAPWLKPNRQKKGYLYNNILYKLLPNSFPKTHKRKLYECYNAVGNGGLSLRRTDTFRKILRMPESQPILAVYKDLLRTDSLYNEDIFWSVESSHILKSFSKPEWKEALGFAMETYAQFSIGLTKGQLPFGCHAPLVYEPDFWKKHIPALNN